MRAVPISDELATRLMACPGGDAELRQELARAISAQLGGPELCRRMGARDARLAKEQLEAALCKDLASTLGELGRTAEAREAAAEVLRMAPGFSIREYMAGLSYRNPEDSRRVERGLRRAGLPE